MGLYRYRGRTAGGALVTGRIDGDSPDSVAAHLVSGSIAPIEIALAAPAHAADVTRALRRVGLGRPGTRELVLFTRQMYSITRSGIPLLRGLRSLVASTRHAWLREVLGDVADSLESGRELAACLARHPQVFPALYISIVRIGEATGTLEASFQRLGDYLVRDQDLKDRVQAAVRYPLIVCIVIALAVAVLTVFVIPRFAPLFRALGNDVPWPTRALMATASFARNEGGWALGCGALLAWSVRHYVQGDAGRRHWHRWKLRMPVFGRLAHEATLARVCRSLAIALAAGVPIIQALKLIAQSAGNEVMSERVLQLKAGVERGEPVSRAAAQVGLFTPLVLQMMEVGEQTGDQSAMLEDVAGFYEREVDFALKNLGAAIEPLLIITVGAIVAVLALAVFLPMWQMIGKVTAG